MEIIPSDSTTEVMKTVDNRNILSIIKKICISGFRYAIYITKNYLNVNYYYFFKYINI